MTSAIFNEWLERFNPNLHNLQKKNYLTFINSGNYRMISDTTKNIPNNLII